MSWIFEPIIYGILNLGPSIFMWGGLILLAIFYFFDFERFGREEAYGYTVAGILGFRLAYGVSLTWGQYQMWSAHKFSQFLLPPHQPITYFLNYSWSHFWMMPVVGICLATLFYFGLRGLKSYKPRFFEVGEVKLGFATALIAGWPGFLVFLPMGFVFLVGLSLYKLAFDRGKYTTMGAPFILAAAMTLLVEPWLIDVLGLEVFSP